jgi:DNA polymerase-3 subunit beta
MNISCKTEDLKKIFSIAEKCTSKNTNLDILQYIKMYSDKSKLYIQATDLSSGISLSIDCVNKEDDSAVFDAKPISQFLGFITDENITITSQETLLVFTSGKQKISIKTFNKEDYPNIPKLEGVFQTISSELLLQGLESVAYAVSHTDIKPELNTVYINTKSGTTYFVATDTFRLAEKKIQIPHFEIESSICIPQKSIEQLLILLATYTGTLSICFSESQISITHSAYYFTTRLVQGSYPQYEQIIPKKEETVSIVLVSDIQKGIKSAAIFSDAINQVSLTLDKESIVIFSENNTTGSQTTTIDAKTTGPSLTLKCNARYLLDVFSHIQTDTLSFSCNGPTKAFVVRPISDQSFLYLVMPMSK